MSFPLISVALGLAEFAPVIARWLGGDKAETVASHVIDMAKRVTSADDGIDAIRVLQDSPGLVASFQKEVVKMEAEFELHLLQDRQNARSRDLALLQVGRKNLRADIMVTSAALGLIVCLACLSFFAGNLPGEAVGIISTIAGIFGACLKDAYAFEFGSSRGSKEKDMTVASLVEKGVAI